MDTFKFDFEKFLEICKAYGAIVTEGDQGITVNGEPITGKDLFPNVQAMEEYQFPADQETSNCTIQGYTPDIRNEIDALKLATMAA